MNYFAAPLILAAALSASAAAEYALVKQWETAPVLSSAESVLYSAKDGLLFVSNMGPSQKPGAKDGDGSIGKVALDGSIIEAEWIKGLDAPKGLGLFDGKLYVADIDRVHVIDVARGEIAQTIAIEGAASLNDVSVGDSGAVYITDHKMGKVFVLADGKQSVAVPEIANPNGVLASGGELYVLARGVAYRKTGDGALEAKVSDLDLSVDGMENIQGDDFIVSCSKGIIYAVDVGTGANQVLFDGRERGIQTADIGYDPLGRMVYAPTLFTHQVIAFKLVAKEGAGEPRR